MRPVQELVGWECDDVHFAHPTARGTPKLSTFVIGKRIYFCYILGYLRKTEKLDLHMQTLSF